MVTTWQRKSLLVLMALVLVLSVGGCGSNITVSTPSASVVEEPLPDTTDNNQATPSKLVVHFIDVGQADSILIQSPDGKNALIDAGNNGDEDTVINYLKANGVSQLDVVIGTHPHEDHIGSMDKVIETFEIGQIIMPKVSANTDTYGDLLAAIKVKNLELTEARAGLILDLGEQVTAQLIAPNADSYEDLNSYSAVVKITYGTTSFLFMGDADEIAEKEMLAAGYDVSANVVKIGHHGSNTSSSSGFLAQVSPEYAIISVGQDNKYNHPSNATMARLATVGSEIHRTDEEGNIIIESNGSEIVIITQY